MDLEPSAALGVSRTSEAILVAFEEYFHLQVPVAYQRVCGRLQAAATNLALGTAAADISVSDQHPLRSSRDQGGIVQTDQLFAGGIDQLDREEFLQQLPGVEFQESFVENTIALLVINKAVVGTLGYLHWSFPAVKQSEGEMEKV